MGAAMTLDCVLLKRVQLDSDPPPWSNPPLLTCAHASADKALSDTPITSVRNTAFRLVFTIVHLRRARFLRRSAESLNGDATAESPLPAELWQSARAPA